ncbi:HK97 family phage prohead protease [Flavobacterium sp. 3-210]
MESKDYIKDIEGAERRFFISEVRAVKPTEESENKTVTIEGYAAKYNKRTTIGGWFEEEILPGAFDDCLADDIRCLFNHNPNFILARTVSGTLKVEADAIGFKYSYVSPDRSYANDLRDSIDKGDVSESSFAFRIKEEKWTAGDPSKGILDFRQIVKFEKIYDVAPVTYPAYPDTEVASRSLTAAKKELESRDSVQGENKGLSVLDAQILINKNFL